MGTLIQIINVVFAVGYVLLIGRAVDPWFPRLRKSAIMKVLHLATDPLLVTIRLGLPPAKIGFDFSPFAGIIILWLLQGFIIHYILGG
ncbi:MAG: YggT family protein [Candidatus Margulisbacteria bacterium]|jgi:uncharacterized protein YggT (Ycf19 family)|nr:YggT family protein [Candidatus Margulisiibacteriota bacterium]